MTQPRVTVALITALAIVPSMNTTLQAQARGGYGYSYHLSGTYELDRSRSDNAEQIARRSTSGLPPGQRDRVYSNVANRVIPPDMISLEVTNRTVTMMSPNAPRLTFEADGRSRTEVGPNGRNVTSRADFRRGVITISMTGDRGSSYTAVFEPNDDGMRVTRRIDNGYNSTPVVVVSQYRRVGDARWNMGNSNVNNDYDRNRGTDVWRGTGRNRRDAGFMPSGTTLTTELDRSLNTNSIRNGDRISMTVVAPDVYRGTVIEGVVGRTQGSDQDNILVDFESIRMADGRSGDFEGVIESIRMPNGREIRVDQSGAVKGDDAGKSNDVKSGAIGAGVGAILGAIIGGTKGAVVGGVAGGAGGIILDRADNNRTLPAGTRFTVSAVSSGNAITKR